MLACARGFPDDHRDKRGRVGMREVMFLASQPAVPMWLKERGREGTRLRPADRRASPGCGKPSRTRSRRSKSGSSP